jgi:hypothetical protein
MQPWINALLDIDHRQQKQQLINLLKSETAIPAEARWHIADLLERYNLKRPRGGKRTPSYDRSPAEERLTLADVAARQYLASGISLEQSIQRAASSYEVDPETLHAFHAGRHSSARRINKRRLVPLGSA